MNETYGLHGAFAGDHQRGLTKREYFAATAMQGLIANNVHPDNVPLFAVEMADKLIAALNKPRTV